MKADGDLVMGAGLAKDAAKMFPYLPSHWGICTRLGYPCIDLNEELLGVPTKSHYKDKTTHEDISEGIRLIKWFNRIKPTSVGKLLVPMMGCGLGGYDEIDFIHMANQTGLSKAATIVHQNPLDWERYYKTYEH